jgi:hypothetical protein
VRIDPAFANTMDEHAGAAGFEVHENRGGRSTLAFSYPHYCQDVRRAFRSAADDHGVETGDVIAPAADAVGSRSSADAARATR